MRNALIFVAASGVLAGASMAATIHVDDDAPNDPGPGTPAVSDPLEDGSAAHPFDSIQEAIDASVDGDEILVAGGTYAGLGNHSINFGGRDIAVIGATDAVIIDISGGVDGVVLDSGESTAARLEQVRILNQEQDGEGIALQCSNGSALTVVSCVFNGHVSSGQFGNAVRVGPGSAVAFEQCEFADNMIVNDRSNSGGAAVYADHADTSFVSCTFTDNLTNTVDDCRGGAVWIDGGTSRFVACSAGGCELFGDEGTMGGAFCFESPSVPVELTACVFSSNACGQEGRGGAVASLGSPVIMRDCTFTDNSCDASCFAAGGAVYVDTEASQFTRCEFTQNSVSAGGSCGGGGTAFAGAVYAIDATYDTCRFTGNHAGSSAKFGAAAAGASLLEGTYRRCTFVGNTAHLGGALATSYFREPRPVVIESCQFVSNVAVLSDEFGDSPGRGGAINMGPGAARIVNSTFVSNEAMNYFAEPGLGGAIMTSADAEITNCVVRDNVPDQITNLSVVMFSNVEGAPALNGNIDADPLFVDALNGDYRLMAGSPCIDAGSSLETQGELDLDGLPRMLDDPVTPNTGLGPAPHPDMGAFEFQPTDDGCPADLDASGSIDFNDVLMVLGDWGSCVGCASDLNGDGVVSLSDLLVVLGAWGPCS